MNLSLPQPLATTEPTARCVNHDGVVMAVKCDGCGRPICEVCAFRFAARAWCADCMTAGPSADVRAAATRRGALSIALAVLGFIILIALFLLGAAGGAPEGLTAVLGIAWFACGLGGLTFGLLGREGRTGSVLPVIGMVANGLLLLVMAILSFTNG